MRVRLRDAQPPVPDQRDHAIGASAAIARFGAKENVVLFEDDHESELNFSGRPLPALKSMDTEGRVIYLGSLSKTLAHGLRLGFIVAPTELIRELRAVRRLMMRHVPSNNAHIASLFIAQGRHEAFIRKLNLTYRDRRQVLLAAMERWMPDFAVSEAQGGSGAWVQGPVGFDALALAQQAQERGVLIEAGQIFFAQSTTANRRFFRMGYSAIGSAAIEAGVRELCEARTLAALSSLGHADLAPQSCPDHGDNFS